jgi:multiple sugar transport system permease protein
MSGALAVSPPPDRASGAAGSAMVAAAGRRLRRREASAAYLFLLPNLAIFLVFLVVPIGWVARQSLMTGGVLGDPTYVGLGNWRDAIHDHEFRRAIGHSVQFAVMFVPAVLVLSLGVALLLRRIKRGAGLLRVVVYLPSIAPIVLTALVWLFMVHPDFGLLNVGARAVGVGTPNWLGDSSLAMPTIVLMELWRGVGFWAVLLLAALLAIPETLYEAARVDGASGLRRFLHISLPGIRPTLVVVALLTTVASLQVFDSVFVLTGGGPAGATRTVGVYIYNTIFQNGEPGYGAALSLFMVVLVVGCTAAYGIASRRASSGD